MEKPIVIAIVGASGCGKTTLINHCISQLGLSSICSYTTRKMRDCEMDGIEHMFVNKMYYKKHVKHLVDSNSYHILAYTYFNKQHYWAYTSQLSTSSATLYAIDEKGLEELITKFEDKITVVPIKIVIPDSSVFVDQSRIKRDKCRPKDCVERINEYINNHGYIINNSGSLESFLEIGTQTIKSAIELCQHQNKKAQ